MILELAYYGHPILRRKAEKVEVITDEIRVFVREMMQTMEHHRGGGLAAPQVGKLLRIFIARLNPSEASYEEWAQYPIDVFINPELSEPSPQTSDENEGCLSIPGIYAKVTRPTSIRIRAIDLEGRPIDRVYQGYLARQLMHENDHLNGVLYIDRLPRAQKESVIRHLDQQRKRKQR